MSVMAGLMLTMAAMTPSLSTAAAFDLRDADAAAWTPADAVDDRLPVRFTDGMRKPRRSRYLLPNVTAVEEDGEPARLRFRGRKVKLRVPIGVGS